MSDETPQNPIPDSSKKKDEGKSLPAKEVTQSEKNIEAYIPEEVRDMVENLPDGEKKQFLSILALTIQRSWRGPLPPPDILKQYNEAVNNGADRIITMTENQSRHRIDMERIAITRELNQSGRGQNYAFAIAIIVLVISAMLIYTGHDVAGSVLGGLDLVALTSVFIFGKYSQKKDLDSKK